MLVRTLLFVTVVSIAELHANGNGNGPGNSHTIYDSRAKYVIFRLSTRSHALMSKTFTYTSTKKPVFTQFSPLRKTIVYIHGRTLTPPYTALAQEFLVAKAFLKNEDVNVIVVLWDLLQSFPSSVGVESATFVGKHTSNLLKYLKAVYKLNMKNVHVIAHNYGTIAAEMIAVGGNESEKIEMVTALDPQLVVTSERPSYSELKKFVELVQVIHTSGLFDELGDRDFFPNGGKKQPGCPLAVLDECNTLQAFVNYVLAVHYGGNLFIARHCSSYVDYLLGKCKNKAFIPMHNQFEVGEVPNGKYYLKCKYIFSDSFIPYARNQTFDMSSKE